MNRRRKAFTALCLALVAAPALALVATSGADAQDSAADLFQKKCMTCHRPDAPAATHGPSLKGVFNRAIASESGYAYSDALKGKAGQRWTAANLDAFLTKPKDWAPGTKMLPSVSDPAQRAAMIDYLKTLK